ncbi:MAG: FecR domain-containing protein, partial [Deltaproteobacteria bacterium]|nr:FecR domain-containing protein [Deltaproteobacteria bacterium]
MSSYRFQHAFFVLLLFLMIDFCPGISRAEEPCDQWVAKVVSVQGTVSKKAADGTVWVPVRINDTLGPGDMIRTHKRSRVAVVLCNESTLRLDQHATLTFSGIEAGRTSIIELFMGAVHFFSRMKRSLKIITPFVNGAVEGTEFVMRVGPDEAVLTVFEGRVSATNEAGSLMLGPGQSASARRDAPPVLRTV